MRLPRIFTPRPPTPDQPNNRGVGRAIRVPVSWKNGERAGDGYTISRPGDDLHAYYLDLAQRRSAGLGEPMPWADADAPTAPTGTDPGVYESTT